MNFNIAIDGPAGAGKSTIAKSVAKKLNYIYVDTGAMYRAFGLYFIRNNIKADDIHLIEDACNKVDITIKYENEIQQVFLNNENVTDLIRTKEAGNMASEISVHLVVRKKLVALQRKLSKTSDVVMDGRDIGTDVLPDAFIKIYLTASSIVRAKRRMLENLEKGIQLTLEEIEKDIIERDNRDMSRENSPLKKAEDAILIDSSDMTIGEVIEKIIQIYNNARKDLP